LYYARTSPPTRGRRFFPRGRRTGPKRAVFKTEFVITLIISLRPYTLRVRAYIYIYMCVRSWGMENCTDDGVCNSGDGETVLNNAAAPYCRLSRVEFLLAISRLRRYFYIYIIAVRSTLLAGFFPRPIISRAPHASLATTSAARLQGNLFTRVVTTPRSRARCPVHAFGHGELLGQTPSTRRPRTFPGRFYSSITPFRHVLSYLKTIFRTRSIGPPDEKTTGY